MPRGGAVWQESLVAALAALGHTEQTARQAVARSTRDGWLSGERVGRRTRMTVTPGTAQMLEQGRERIFGFGREVEWDRRWLVVVLRIPENRRRVRHHVRTRLARAGMGSLGGGVWIAPHADREPLVAAALQAAGATDEAVSFRAGMGSLGRAGGPASRPGTSPSSRPSTRASASASPRSARAAARRASGRRPSSSTAGGGSRSSTPTCRPSCCRAAGRAAGLRALPPPQRRLARRGAGATSRSSRSLSEALEPFEHRRAPFPGRAGRARAASRAPRRRASRGRRGRGERRRATAPAARRLRAPRRESARCSRRPSAIRERAAPREHAVPQGLRRELGADAEQRRRAAGGEERLVEVGSAPARGRAARAAGRRARARASPRPRGASRQGSSPARARAAAPWARAGSASRRRRASPPPRPLRRARRAGAAGRSALARERAHGLAQRRRAHVPLAPRAPRRARAHRAQARRRRSSSAAAALPTPSATLCLSRFVHHAAENL